MLLRLAAVSIICRPGYCQDMSWFSLEAKVAAKLYTWQQQGNDSARELMARRPTGPGRRAIRGPQIFLVAMLV